MKQKMVIIGGGSIKDETLPFDKRIVELTGKKHPKALFIPTASSDSAKYVEYFTKTYEQKLGCNVDTLLLLQPFISKKEIQQKIAAADLIYVGGGNTLKMMRRWRHLGVDTLLSQAHRKGTVCSGLSAGGICWFQSGHSDSMSFYHPNSWNYINVKGLGALKGIHCPHFNGNTDGKKRKEDFLQFMKKYSTIGIAIDNHCAIEWIDDSYRVLSSKKTCNAYRVYKKNHTVIMEKIPIEKGLRPIKDLYDTKKSLY